MRPSPNTDRLEIGKTISPRIERERDTLIGDANTFNKAFRYYRAGNCVCETCGLEYIEHPVIRAKERRHYGCELHVLCNTDRVKL